jgi:BolA family transcriptional regulator, general stress-responsive regulator
MDRINSIRERITMELHPETLEIRDDSGMHAGHAGAVSGGGHFTVKVVSDKFSGKSALERHRMVFASVGDLMPGEIHALSIQALTPEEQVPET